MDISDGTTRKTKARMHSISSFVTKLTTTGSRLVIPLVVTLDNEEERAIHYES